MEELKFDKNTEDQKVEHGDAKINMFFRGPDVPEGWSIRINGNEVDINEFRRALSDKLGKPFEVMRMADRIEVRHPEFVHGMHYREQIVNSVFALIGVEPIARVLPQARRPLTSSSNSRRQIRRSKYA